MRTWDELAPPPRRRTSRSTSPLRGDRHHEGGALPARRGSLRELRGRAGRAVAEKVLQGAHRHGSDARGVRRPRTLQELCALADAARPRCVAVIEVFRRPGRSFLMPPSSVPLHADSVVDISHESLMRVLEAAHRVGGRGGALGAGLPADLEGGRAVPGRQAPACWRDPELQLALQLARGDEAERGLGAALRHRLRAGDGLPRAQQAPARARERGEGAPAQAPAAVGAAPGPRARPGRPGDAAVRPVRRGGAHGGGAERPRDAAAEGDRRRAAARGRAPARAGRLPARCAPSRRAPWPTSSGCSRTRSGSAPQLQEREALRQKSEAEAARQQEATARGDAERQRLAAVQQRERAETLRVQAEQSETEARRLRVLAVARELAIKTSQLAARRPEASWRPCSRCRPTACTSATTATRRPRPLRGAARGRGAARARRGAELRYHTDAVRCLAMAPGSGRW